MKLVQKYFTSWLEHKKPHDTVGDIGEAKSCPIALYILDKNPKHVVKVWNVSYLVKERGGEYVHKDLCEQCGQP